MNINGRSFLPALRDKCPDFSIFTGLRRILDYHIPVITSVGRNYQVTIPEDLVHQLGILPGQRLDWSAGEDGTLIVRILPNRDDLASKAAGMGKDWLKPGMDPVKDLVEERARQDDDTDLLDLVDGSVD